MKALCPTEMYVETFRGNALIRASELTGLIKPLFFTTIIRRRPFEFTHDLYRDYFAAQALLGQPNFEQTILRCIEDKKWDQAVIMACEFVCDREVFGSLTQNVSKIDPLLAIQCAQNNPNLTEEQIDWLLTRTHSAILRLSYALWTPY